MKLRLLRSAEFNVGTHIHTYRHFGLRPLPLNPSLHYATLRFVTGTDILPYVRYP